MASLDILCFNPFTLKNKIMKIEHKKIFHDPSKILKNISWPINICLNYFMAPTKTLNFAEFLHLKTQLLLRQSSSSGTHLDWSVRKICVCDVLGKNS